MHDQKRFDLKRFFLFFLFLSIKMLDKNFLITLVGLFIAIFAILSMTPNSSGPVENFWGGPAFGTKKLAPLDKRTEKLRDFGYPFAAVSNRQANIAPRMNGGQTRSAIRGPLPALAHLASPSNPMSFETQESKEDYGYSQGYTENFEDPSVPIGDMTQPNLIAQPVIYDRLIFSNKNSRTRSKGDMIRGDLAIAPTQTGWFQVSANPSLDLQQGAMSIITDASSQANLARLITAAGGNDFTTSVSAGGDVRVSSNP